MKQLFTLIFFYCVLFSAHAQQWHSVSSNSNVPAFGISGEGGDPFLKFVTPSTGVIVTETEYSFTDELYYNSVFVTNDSGNSWRSVYANSPPWERFSMVSDYSFFYTVLYDRYAGIRKIYKSTDALLTNGILIGQSNSPGICFTDSLHGCIYGNYTTDGGITWLSSIVNGGNGAFLDIYFINSQEGWSTDTSHVFKTTDGGITWNNIYTSVYSNNIFKKIMFTDPLNGFILSGVSYSDSIIKTTDGGVTWTSVVIPLDSHFGCNDFNFINSQRGWVTAKSYDPSNCGIYYTHDGGNTFVKQDSSSVFLLSFVDSTIAFAAGSTILLKTTSLRNTDISISEINKQNHFNLYPNPASNKVLINSEAEIYAVDLLTVEGKLMLTTKVKGSSCTLLTHNIINGVYVIRVNFKNYSETQKMIIEH